MKATIALLTLLQVWCGSSWFISHEETYDVFSCWSLVNNAYVDNHIQSFSLPVPSSARSVTMDSRRIVINYPHESSITIYPKLKSTSGDTDYTIYSQGEAMLYDTWFRIKNNQLRAKRVSFLIRSNIGEIIVTCPPVRREIMLTPLLELSVRNKLTVQRIITMESDAKGIIVILSQLDGTKQSIRIPPKCRTVHYEDVAHIECFYDNQQAIFFSRKGENIEPPSLDKLNRFPISIGKKKYRYYLQEQNDYIVTYFIIEDKTDRFFTADS